MIHVSKIRLVIADDNRFFAEALRDNLLKISCFEVVGVACDIKSVISCVQKKQLDVLILDVNFTGENSLDYLNQIRQENSAFKIIILTSIDTAYTKAYAKSKGVDMFLSKNSVFSNFEEQIKKCYLSLGSETLSDNYGAIVINGQKFTPTKIKVLKALYVYSDLTELQISEYLNISLSALKGHKKDLFELSNTNKIAGLLKFGIEHGILLT